MRRRCSSREGKNDPGPHFGDLQVEVAGLGGQQPFAVPVASGGAMLGVLARGDTDGFARFGLDEFLQDALAQHPDRFDSAGRT